VIYFKGPSKHLEITYKKYIQRLSLTLDKVNYLTIALVNGGAIGAGVGLALACDLFGVYLRNAYFKLPFFNLALVPADGSFWRLAEKIRTNQRH
jgi:enoyl-CoA hydratase/carnithine racemase